MIDDKNRQLIIEAIKKTYKLDFVPSEGQYCSYDIYYRDQAAIELKERTYNSKAYNDNTMEYYKYRKLREMIDKNDFQVIWLISTYSDGIIRVSNIMTDTFVVQTKKAQHTTCFSDNLIINKNFVHFTSFIDYKIVDGKFVKVQQVTAPIDEPDVDGE